MNTIFLFIVAIPAIEIFLMIKIGQNIGAFNTILLIIFFTSTINITTNLILQHKKPNAISSVKNVILKKGFQFPIASTPLINYYLQQHGLENDFLDIESDEDIRNIKSSGEYELFLIGNFKKQFLSDYFIISDSTYYHNPYVLSLIHI